MCSISEKEKRNKKIIIMEPLKWNPENKNLVQIKL